MAASGHLLITDILLTDSRERVGRVNEELEHQRSSSSEYDGVFGEKHLQGTFHDFSGDWKLHREKLRKNVDKLHKNLENMNETFTDIQQQLTDALQIEQQG